MQTKLGGLDDHPDEEAICVAQWGSIKVYDIKYIYQQSAVMPGSCEGQTGCVMVVNPTLSLKWTSLGLMCQEILLISLILFFLSSSKLLH